MAKVTQQNVTRQIKGEIYSSLRNALVAPQGKTKKSWTDTFIEKMLEEAKKNPSGPLGQLISKQLLQDDIISSLDEQTEKLLARDWDFIRYRILKQCFRQQRDVLLDTFISRKLCMTSRRAGKTNTAGRLLVDTCVEPNTPALYIHTKFENAIKQCFQLCIDVAKEAELPIERASSGEGIIEFSNGSSITFKGNNNRAAADMLRGGKYKTIIIDEAAFECNMKYLVEDTCIPMLADFPKSQLVLISTPPRVPKTYFEECLHNEREWTIYKWDARSNPFIPDFQAFIDEICEKKGLTKDSPFIKRELYGELVYDTEAQVFKDAKRWKEIPFEFIPTDAAIGVDYGFSDYNAIVPLVYNRNTGKGYVLPFVKKFNKASVSGIVNECREVFDKTLNWCLDKNSAFQLNRIFIYADTNEQSITYEMSTKYGLPVTNCYKYDKALAISELSEWLRTGLIEFNDDILADEFERTVYKRDENDNILSEIDDDVFHPDALDALLYASRQFAYDTGKNTGGESSDKKSIEEKDTTIPEWLNKEDEEEW